MLDDSLLSMLDVQPAALLTFSENIMTKASAASSGMTTTAESLGSAKFGFAPVMAADPLTRRYADTVGQLAKFMEDVSKGTGAFMVGAQTIAANYVISDDAGKDEMNDVQAAFDISNVPPGQQLYSQMVAEDAQKAADEVGAIEPVPLPTPTDSSPNEEAPPPDTPGEQAAKKAEELREFDTEKNDGNGFRMAYPSEDAPLEVQLEANKATADTQYLNVVDDEGNPKIIENPIYDGPDYDPGYSGG
ncbi:hypothetical protein EK0264_11670 [Epidermidibacterium keratini]|uniref:Uncharacterized protein n=1 Tax=Epidermidibacterium keratini TaxID=1891644 RepID=A0A7L4YP75_9ACTN|nr:hypothetical protein [Epidermidibacterium keratini]QHC00878.1 hypothetical protein EK0264_11670 [Epidermidibacterium keratini]